MHLRGHTKNLRTRSSPHARPLLRARAVSLAVVMGLLCAVSESAAADETALWAALRQGDHVALLRHAIAPGTGDPPEFSLRDCSTQRNLSDAGRAQAERIGARFRANEIQTADVYSSQWCRCLETAESLGIGPVEELSALNSFYQRYERREPQMRALETWLASQDLDGPLVLVTHQVNITALSGVYPSSGELVIIHRSDTGEITVVGTVETE